MSEVAESLKSAHMLTIYQWICEQPDEQKAVEELEDYALRDILGWFARSGVISGIPGRIYSIAIVEASTRFERNAGGGK
jgi:hypothetical protein